VDGKPAVWWRIAPGAVWLDGGARSTPPFQVPKSDRSERHDTVRRIGGLWEAHPANGTVLSIDHGMGLRFPEIRHFHTAGDAIAALDRWNEARSAGTVAAFAGWVNEAVDARSSADYVAYLGQRGRQAEREMARLKRMLRSSDDELAEMRAKLRKTRKNLRFMAARVGDALR
jgi:hypothetical protein